jgi:regulator of replication initiation timing
MRGYDPFMEEQLIGHNNPELYQPKDPLDTKDQHIVALAMKNGFLVGRNSVLEVDNESLKRRVAEQERLITDGTAENKRLRERVDEEREERYTAQREADRLKQYEPKKKGTTK